MEYRNPLAGYNEWNQDLLQTKLAAGTWIIRHTNYRSEQLQIVFSNQT